MRARGRVSGEAVSGLGRDADHGGMRWEQYDHPTLYAMVAGAKPERIGYRAGKWAKLSDNLADLNDQLHAALTQLADAWSGPAAATALRHTEDLQRWADEAVSTSRTVSARLGDYADAVAAARKAMPEPVVGAARPTDNDTEPRSMLVAEGDFYQAAQRAAAYQHTTAEQEARTQQARAVMHSLEAESRSIKHETPHFRPEPAATGAPAPEPHPPISPAPPVPPPLPPAPPEPRPDSSAEAPETGWDHGGTEAQAATTAPVTLTAPLGPHAANPGPPGGTHLLGGFADARTGPGTPHPPATPGRGPAAMPKTAPPTSPTGGAGAAARGAGAATRGAMMPTPAGTAPEEDEIFTRSRYVKDDTLFTDERVTAPPVIGA